MKPRFLIFIAGFALFTGQFSTAWCWEIPTEPKARFSVGRIFSANFSPDGESIIVLSSWGCWVYKNSSFPKAPVLLEESDYAFVFHSLSFSVNFSADGVFFAFGEGQKVKVWDAKSWKAIREFEEPSGFIESVSLSRDGKLLAVGLRNGVIKLWELASGDCVATLAKKK